MRRAARGRVASGRIVTAGVVISSSARVEPALAVSPRRRICSIGPGSCSWNSSLGRRSASETTPTTRPSPSMTGRAVTFHRFMAAAMSLKPVEGVTAMTSVVITSATVYGVEVMVSPQVAWASGMPLP